MISYKVICGISRNKYPWLTRRFKKGKIVYRYDNGCMMGLIKNGFVACSLELNKTPWYELPLDHLEML